MSVDTVANFAAMLAKNHLLDPLQMEEISTHLLDRFPDPRALARELVQRGWLTPFQANKLFLERGDDLLLGSYILLERLGVGGMGEVYKARHAKLDKIVAIKLVRSDRLNDAETLRRFQREVRAAAQLNHPNIVHAYDCDEAGGKHFLVLEYVEGIDLARLVKKQGPLPMAQACDYIRQAALGLQHAFEHGLVHRDIKPHNLLLTQSSGRASSVEAVVKILDLGLARLSRGAESESTSTMTGLGMVMGTLDYLAPEQARDAHSADTRADLYSLGCTFFFLLAGRVPFPGGGGATEKLLKHQVEQPPALRKFRPDLPPALAAIVSKLMAKRPEARYQTPAELAILLSQLRDFPPASSPAAPAAPDQAEMTDTSPCWSSLGTGEEEAQVVCHAEPHRPAERGHGKRVVLAIGAGLLALGALLLFLLARGDRSPPQSHAVVEQAPRRATAPRTFDDWKNQVEALPVAEQIKAVTAKLRRYNPHFDGDVKSTIQDTAVVGLEFNSDHMTDLRPLQALPKLQKLVCPGSRGGEDKLSDLSPLKGLKLTTLNCAFTDVADLSPLQGMELSVLVLVGNRRITELSPLRGMPLTALYCRNTGVQDLSPLRDMPLRILSCPIAATKDHATLRSLKHLRNLNGKPIAEFWKNDGADESDSDP